MEIIHSAGLLNEKLIAFKNTGKSIGFVPTMGALHQGHMSLLEFCKSANDVSVVSIFVNPTQFNDADDLQNYPRNLDKDLDLLAKASCDFAFCPDELEIYPEPDLRVFHFGDLDRIMEGKFRPGHFNGVAQVVSRLLDIVKPSRIYLGMKDFQQVGIIKKMINDLSIPVEVITCPTVREADGLALSSRNFLLSKGQRSIAAQIPQILNRAKKMSATHTLAEIKHYVTGSFTGNPEFKLDYFEIVDENTMMPVNELAGGNRKIGCIAVRIGSVRLIDNVQFSL